MLWQVRMGLKDISSGLLGHLIKHMEKLKNKDEEG
jgi:hypothetical protein